jgi:cytochrome c-type biogenesis protein CcmF
MTIPGVRSSLQDDFYVLLVGWEPIAQEGATFKIYHNPAVNFVWMGGLIFIAATLLAAWPTREFDALREAATARAVVARA